MAKPGQIVVVDFPGVQGVKRRPAVIISSEAYHKTRPDVVFGLVTSQLSSATGLTDCTLQDWQAAGLRTASAFRAFLVTLPRAAVTAVIGQISNRDWEAIQNCIRTALAI